MAINFGAIRWDAWYANDVGDYPGYWELRTLSSPRWQDRAPPHTLRVGRARLQYDISQANMDQEIAWANQAGLSYWAYLMYTTGADGTDPVRSGKMDVGLKLYRSSTNKNGLKWCMIQQGQYMGSPGDYLTEVFEMAYLMAEPDYHRVLADRPLFYIYTSGGFIHGGWGTNYTAFSAMLLDLRARVQQLGAGNPYIVLMMSGGNLETVRAAIGADAVSNYSGGNNYDIGGTYATLAGNMESGWLGYLAAAGMIPLCMMGWDRRPRDDRPGPWEPATRPHFGNPWYQYGTPTEVANHITAAKNFIAANPTKCPSETIIAYAWNEFSEGGWICPNLGDVGAATGDLRLDAIAGVLQP